MIYASAHCEENMLFLMCNHQSQIYLILSRMFVSDIEFLYDFYDLACFLNCKTNNFLLRHVFISVHLNLVRLHKPPSSYLNINNRTMQVFNKCFIFFVQGHRGIKPHRQLFDPLPGGHAELYGRRKGRTALHDGRVYYACGSH